MTDISNFSNDFLRGQRDCRDGKPHRDGQSEAYDLGYNIQYVLNQINDAETVDQFNKINNGE